MNKQQWKKVYRLIRVSRREAQKASIDMLLYGTGAVFIPNNGSDPKHIPAKDLIIIKGKSKENPHDIDVWTIQESHADPGAE